MRHPTPLSTDLGRGRDQRAELQGPHLLLKTEMIREEQAGEVTEREKEEGRERGKEILPCIMHSLIWLHPQTGRGGGGEDAAMTRVMTSLWNMQR